MEPNNNLNTLIKKIKVNYCLVRGIKGFLRGILVSLILGLGYFLAGVFLNWSLDLEYLLFYLGLPILLGILIGLFWPISESKIIKKVDQKFVLKERLITLYEYQNKTDKNPFIIPLKQSVIRDIKQIEGSYFSIKWRPELKYIGVLISVIILMGVWMNTADISYYNLVNQKKNEIKQEDTQLPQKKKEKEKLQLLNPMDIPQKESSDKEKTVSEMEKSEGDINNQLKDKLDQSEEQRKNDDQKNMKDRLNSKEDQDFNQKANPGGGSDQSKKGEKKVGSGSGKGTKKQKSNENTTAKLQKGDGKNKENVILKKRENTKKETPSPNKEDKKEAISPDEDNKNNAQGDQPEEENKNKQNIITEKKKTTLKQKRSLTVGSGKGNNKQGENESSQGAGTKQGTNMGQSDSLEPNENLKGSKLRSQLIKESYLNSYLEELYPPDVEGNKELVVNNYLQYRDYLLDALNDQNIPARHKKIIKDYFSIIK